MKANTVGGVRGAVQMKPEGISGINVTLKQLMRFAYELQAPQISGPGWMETDGYDIVATVNRPASTPQLRLALQRLLGVASN